MISALQEAPKALIQLIDVSDKILVNDIKGEHEFIEMVSAAFSHQLKNPLNSMVNEIQNLRNLIHRLKDTGLGGEEATALDSCYQNLDSATKLIDFFIQTV